jgi:hypothetical protein|tara:strand:+ start:243 stop:455 length:213 start_codon:yes stop_codon:yes gene_type:complete
MLVKFWLSPNEVTELTGAKSRSKQLKVLDFMGYSYRVRPDGSFVVPVEQFSEQQSYKPLKEYKLDFAALG